MTKVAVFGGTFDPPTLAHEKIIAACLAQDFDEVWVMPSGMRLDKPDMLSDVTRLALLGVMREEVFDSNPRLVVADFETKLAPPTCTRRTAQAMERNYPNNRFWFVFGADSYRTMNTWEQGDMLKAELHMLIVAREGEDMPVESGHIKHLEIGDDIYQDISSTKVREALQTQQPIDKFVSSSIARFLAERGCYAATQSV